MKNLKLVLSTIALIFAANLAFGQSATDKINKEEKTAAKSEAKAKKAGTKKTKTGKPAEVTEMQEKKAAEKEARKAEHKGNHKGESEGMGEGEGKPGKDATSDQKAGKSKRSKATEGNQDSYKKAKKNGTKAKSKDQQKKAKSTKKHAKTKAKARESEQQQN